MPSERRSMTSGEKLFQWLYQRYKNRKCNDSWVNEISMEFEMESLEDLLLRSTLIMLMRRLLRNAEAYMEKYHYKGDLDIIETYEKDYLRAYFGLSREDIRYLSPLIFNAYSASCRNIPHAVEEQMFRDAEQRKERCYICGKPINYTDREDALYFSLDHRWPRSLGGESEDWNLAPSHSRCNSERKNIVEASDTHYEHFHIKNDWTPNIEDNYWRELEWQFRIAAYMRANFRCEVCHDPLPIHQIDGALSLLPRDEEEHLNIFNVQVTCDKHNRLLHQNVT